MKRRCVLLAVAMCVLAGSASAVLVPLAEWKMDTADLLGDGPRTQVPNEVTPGPGGLVMGESTMPNWPILTADGGGVSGLPGDKALDFTTDVTAAYNNTMRPSSYYPDIDIAFEFDINPRSITDEQSVMYSQGSWEFRIRDGKLIFYVNKADGSLASLRTDIVANEWNHVYAECVGEDMLLTIDGVTLTGDGTVIGGRRDTNNRLYMGFAGSKTSPVRVSSALLDELTIYEVIPEPATIVLLGLGGSLFRKKRC